jgi:hypothetical protein
LRGADLREADLRGANLRWANLCRANLCEANLRGADLREADLREANLREADLREADLREANLREADLCGAKNVPDRWVSKMRIVPDGELIMWKKLADRTICKLLVPAAAGRVGGLARKCRVEYAVVLEGEGESTRDATAVLQYRVGKEVRAKNWDPNPLVVCAGGIHCYVTREEAEDH